MSAPVVLAGAPGVIGTVPVAPRANDGHDIGPRRDRGIRPKRTLATTDTSAVQITASPWELVEFAGIHTGYECDFGFGFVAIQPGDMFPVPDSGSLFVRASSSAQGSCIVRTFAYEIGLMRASNRSVVRAISTAPGGLPTQATAMGPSTRQALTTATPGTFTLAATSIFAIVKAKSSNAAVAYIADTVANVAAAGTRFELQQGDFVTVYGSFGFDGTTGDHLFVQEYR